MQAARNHHEEIQPDTLLQYSTVLPNVILHKPSSHAHALGRTPQPRKARKTRQNEKPNESEVRRNRRAFFLFHAPPEIPAPGAISPAAKGGSKKNQPPTQRRVPLEEVGSDG